MFWRITIPLLMPTIYFVTITSTILSLRLFEPILLLTGGGPLNSTSAWKAAPRDLALKERLAAPDVPSDDHTA